MAVQWVQQFNIKGPQGPKGEPGAAGAKGGSTRIASIDVTANSDVAFSALSPSDGVQVGDIVMDNSGELFVVQSVSSEGSTAHVGESTGISIKGPQGDQGPQGLPGKDGTGINLKGSVETDSALPGEGNEVGDAYLVSEDGSLHIWNGESWTDAGSIQGPSGTSTRVSSTALEAGGATVDSSALSPASDVTTGDILVGPDGSLHQVTNVEGTTVTYGPSLASIKGERGDKGDAGEKGDKGEPGPGISMGSGAPSDGGVVGQLYIDKETGDLYAYQDIQA